MNPAMKLLLMTAALASVTLISTKLTLLAIKWFARTSTSIMSSQKLRRLATANNIAIAYLALVGLSGVGMVVAGFWPLSGPLLKSDAFLIVLGSFVVWQNFDMIRLIRKLDKEIRN